MGGKTVSGEDTVRPPEHGATEVHTVKGGQPVAAQRTPEYEEHQEHQERPEPVEREED